MKNPNEKQPIKTQINVSEFESEVEKLRKKAKLRRRRHGLKDKELRPYLTEILAFSFSKVASKKNTSNFVKNRFKVDVSPGQIYRFVKAFNGGIWPHKKIIKGEKNDPI